MIQRTADAGQQQHTSMAVVRHFYHCLLYRITHSSPIILYIFLYLLCGYFLFYIILYLFILNTLTRYYTGYRLYDVFQFVVTWLRDWCTCSYLHTIIIIIIYYIEYIVYYYRCHILLFGYLFIPSLKKNIQYIYIKE